MATQATIQEGQAILEEEKTRAVSCTTIQRQTAIQWSEAIIAY